MIRLNESVRVGQFAKKSRLFAFPVVVYHGSQSLSWSDSAPPSFSFKRIVNAVLSPVGQTQLLPHSQTN